jgi:ribosomal protein S18 acetylase RimI-like enzyme
VNTPDRLESYMRRAAGIGRETIEIPPFVIFLDARDPLPFFNYAHPLRPIAGDLERWKTELAGPLVEVREVFASRQRTPRFEYVEEYAPGLAGALASAGVMEEGRYPLLVCDPQSYQPAPEVRGLEISQLSRNSSPLDLRDFLAVERQGFGHRTSEEITAEDSEDLRDSLERGGLAFLARLEGEPAGVASCTALLDGLTELAGIATLPSYRGRGIAAALTAAAARTAFARGVDAAFLTAGDAHAGRVYQRVGFRPSATLMAYADALTEQG